MSNNKEHLITSNMKFAQNVARKKYSRNRFVSYDEIESAAYMGLVEAASRYDSEKNDEFAGYAYPRIVGAVCDYLRELRWGSRSAPVAVVEVEDYECRQDRKEGELFGKLTANLPDKSKMMVRLYYFENKKIREIAEEMNLHESRISQVLSHAKDVLKDFWRESEFELWAEVA